LLILSQLENNGLDRIEMGWRMAKMGNIYIYSRAV
jgi:hypothetical protein